MSLKKISIVADKHIPFLPGLLEINATVIYKSAAEITNQLLKETKAEALIVRTRSKCDSLLLKGTLVKFIATATIGFDHIDVAYCKQKKIVWKNAPACNSNSVVNYINAALAFTGLPLRKKTIGIVGVGNVGSRVAKLAHDLGMRVLLNDPPRHECEDSKEFVSIDTIRQESDIISFHVPLLESTFAMVNKSFITSCKKSPLIINSARGEVCSSEDLLWGMDKKLLSNIIIDCWENEPDINKTLLQKSLIGTPHIAGYSMDGKSNATRMVAQAICDYFEWETKIEINLPPIDHTPYNIEIESRDLKASPEKFEYFRNNYAIRRDHIIY